jgi:hypothetical protein
MWQDQLAGMVNGLARRRWRPLADRGDRFAAHRDVAALDNGVASDHLADDHPVEWS